MKNNQNTRHSFYKNSLITWRLSNETLKITKDPVDKHRNTPAADSLLIIVSDAETHQKLSEFNREKKMLKMSRETSLHEKAEISRRDVEKSKSSVETLNQTGDMNLWYDTYYVPGGRGFQEIIISTSEKINGMDDFLVEKPEWLENGRIYYYTSEVLEELLLLNN